MKLVMQFMITSIQILYKLLVYIKFFFTNYKDSEMKIY